MPTQRRPGTVLVLIGGVVLIATVVILIAFPSFYKRELEKQTTLVNDTILFKLWKDLPIPIYQKFYFFNITNGKSFLSSKDRLSVNEIGPYTYSSKWVKENITHDDGTVSYQEVKTYHFEPDLSVGSEDDEIWTLNGPYATAGHIVGAKPSYVQKFANSLFNLLNQELVIKKTIRELIFEGYKDTLLSHSTVKRYFKTPYKDGYFAWFYHKNATDDGLFTVYTGEQNHKTVNIIKSWNGQPELSFWKNNSSCNKITGTNAELGPPLLDNQKTYSFFQSLACRSLTFDYTGEHVHRGINSKRFQNTYKNFATPKINPDNECYVKDKRQWSGVLDLSSCQYEAPVYLSFPHFYLADPYYFFAVEGLNPHEDIHKSYIDVEPFTGVSVSLAIRVQVNLKLDRNKNLRQFEKITSGIYPVFWMEINAEIDEELSHMFNDQLHKPKSVAYTVLGTLSLFSGGLLMWGLGLMRKYRNRMWQEIQPLVDNSRNITYDTSRDRIEPLNISPKFQNRNEPKTVTGTKSNIQVNPCETCKDESCSQTTRTKTTESYSRRVSESIYEGTLKAGAAVVKPDSSGRK